MVSRLFFYLSLSVLCPPALLWKVHSRTWSYPVVFMKWDFQPDGCHGSLCLLAVDKFHGCRGHGFIQAVLVLHPRSFPFASVFWLLYAGLEALRDCSNGQLLSLYVPAALQFSRFPNRLLLALPLLLPPENWPKHPKESCRAAFFVQKPMHSLDLTALGDATACCQSRFSFHAQF